VAQRPHGSRLPDQPVDDGAHCSADRRRIRSALPRQSHWAAHASAAMESSKTRAAGLGAQRVRPRGMGAEKKALHLKKAARLGAHLVFVDESGFLLIPNVAKTWAPIGETPIYRHPYRREKVSVISGVSVSPQRQRLNLYYYLFYDNIGQEEVCLFLQHL